MAVEVSENTPKKDDSRESSDKHINVERYTGAFFLIIIGTIFLLNTTGLLSWSVWLILLRFWPVFIIIAGIQIIFGKSRYGALTAGVITLVVYSAIAIIAIVSTGISFRGENLIRGQWTDRINNILLREPGDLKVEEAAVELTSEEFEAIDLNLNVGIGRFILSDDELLNPVTLRSRFYERMGEPKFDYRVDNETLKVNFSQEDDFGFWGFRTKSPEYTMTLSQEEQLRQLKLNLGVGEGEVDFDQIALEEMQLEVGAGKLEVRLSEASLPQKRSKVEVGTGELIIYIPEGTGYRVKYDVGVGEAEIIDQSISGLGREGEVISDDYEDAENRIDLEIEVGVGKFRLKYF